jgi:hypothetical protein
MRLNEFIKETLTQIVNGVFNSQSEIINSGAVINPSEVHGGYAQNKTSYNGLNMVVSNIDFQVELIEENEDGNNVGIGVGFGAFRAGGDIKSNSKSSSVTNVRFSIPMALPVTKTKKAETGSKVY